MRSLRSNGVYVGIRAKRWIDRGDRLRGRDWQGASHAYQEALRLKPNLAHIWVQLGHCEKEAGGQAAAEHAYRRAVELDAADPDARRYLVELLAASGRHLEAARLHLSCLLANDEAAFPAARRLSTELQSPWQDLAPLLQVRLAALLCALSLPEQRADEDTRNQPSLIFDCSDLFSYFENARLPTGIQRVQIEVVSSAIQESARPVRIGCFRPDLDHWIEIPKSLFAVLAHLSLSGGDQTDPSWLHALNLLRVHMLAEEGFEFPLNSTLVNLGTSWWLQNYFLYVRDAKQRLGLRYVPFVHDLIPIKAPQHCVAALTQDFISWIIGAFQHADAFLVNSQSTKRDLIEVGGTLGHAIDPHGISVVRLDGDYRKTGNKAPPTVDLAQWDLADRPFVLFVSTVESRKNHALAFDAWCALADRHGADRMPLLVCVGNRGWLNEALYERLETEPKLAEMVLMLSHLSDAELERLYRSCLFTFYPSTYEGWGLPITEALCFGKAVLASDSSSLPEAGGPFADYFENSSVPDAVAKLGRLIFDDAYRAAREKLIASDFAPRPWSRIAAEISHVLTELPPEPVAFTPPDLTAGTYYSLARSDFLTIWPGLGNAEIFRAGTSWWPPGEKECWTKRPGGEFDFAFAASKISRKLRLHLRGRPDWPCQFRVINSITGALLSEGVIARDEKQWSSIVIGPSQTRLMLKLEVFQQNGDPLPAEQRNGLRVLGFALEPGKDHPNDQLDFLDAIISGALDRIAAYPGRGTRRPVPRGQTYRDEKCPAWFNELLNDRETQNAILLNRPPLARPADRIGRLALLADQQFPPSGGLFGLERDPQGKSYRWSGPTREFSFDIMLDRQMPQQFELLLLGALFSEQIDDLQCMSEGKFIPLTIAREVDVVRVTGRLPAVTPGGATRLRFITPYVVRPIEIGESEDLRPLGVRFHALTVERDHGSR